MQVLTSQVKTERPGATVYGVGDDEHKTRVSGHNEDDTPGVRAEDQDSDSIPEHRALDIMIAGPLTRQDARNLAEDLVGDADNRARLLYVNFEKTQWARSNNWEPRDNSKDPHMDHVHASGEADQDANTNAWNLPTFSGSTSSGEPEKLQIDGELGPKTITRWQQVMGTKADGVIDPERSSLVAAVQTKLKATVDHRLVVDGQGIYQNNKAYKTAGALQRYLGTPVDCVISAPTSQVIKMLQRRLNENRF
jgi:hypothetical protein